MNCDSARQYVSALCDGEVIPHDAAEHIGLCAECEGRLRDYLTMGVELRRLATVELAGSVPSRVWSKPQGRISKWWQKGSGTMRIPRIAFASMFLVITGLLATLLVVKVRAHSDGTVVLLTTSGPSGRLMDYPLSTVDPKQASYFWQGKAGTQGLVYKVSLLSREGDRVKLLIHARTCSEEDDLSSFTRDSDPAAKVWEVWFEPGEPLKLDVPGLGTLTLTGEWLDHMPNLLEMLHIDHLFPGPNELRFARPLLLKDNKVVGDFASVIGGFYNQDDKDRSAAFYVPGEGRFLISQLPMKSAVEAQVAMGRISFKEGGHSWEFVSGVPVHSADHLWVLHQPSYKPPTIAHSGDRVSFGNPKLVQTEPGVWTPETTPN